MSDFLKTLAGEKTTRPPVWLMRQAGRYLPEYRELRTRAKDFLDFCYSPSLSVEATLQPLRRYPFSAAILFADILLILDAMDRGLRFETGEGPVLNPLEKASDMEGLSSSHVQSRLSPVMETVSRLKAKLPVPLIGFAGSPWTVGVYAIEGRGGTDKREPRLWAYTRREELKVVLDVLVDHTADYLQAQVDAGVDALMLFDSWAEGLPESVFEWTVIEPTRRLVSILRERGVSVPIIGFARGCGGLVGRYARETGINAVGMDTGQIAQVIHDFVPQGMPVQGQLDPLALIAGGRNMIEQADTIMEAYADRPLIFNLGHGIQPPTPPEHVAELIAHVTGIPKGQAYDV